MKTYIILSTLFWFIRQFFIPNPFEVLDDGIPVMINDVPLLLTPDVLNSIAGLVLPAFTYIVVRLFYQRGSAPAVGSILYMILFCVNTGILYLMSFAYPSIWLIMLIGIIYLGLLIKVRILINKCSIW